jgi:hypothetical protein
MHDTAAHLVDRVFPLEVATRQWVLSLPFPVRLLLLRRGGLRREVLKIFLRAITAWQCRTAGVRRGRGGAVTFVQRFGGQLNANVHFHSIVLEGVYTVREKDGAAVFHPVRAPKTEEVAAIAARVAARMRRLFQRRGLLDESSDDAEASALDAAQGAALFGGVVFGPRAGKRVRRLQSGLRSARRCRGSTSTPASPSPLTTGRAWRGSLATGCGRPSPLSRLARAAHGRLTYEPKHPLDDGTTHLVFEPLELLEKLAVLVPPPREHLVLYSGVLAPCASLRDQVVPPPPPAAPGACSGKRGRPPRRIGCAALLKRVFAVQILACALCGGKMRVISVIEEGPVATKILSHLGLPSAAPVRAPARDPPDPELPLPPSTDARLAFAGA